MRQRNALARLLTAGMIAILASALLTISCQRALAEKAEQASQATGPAGQRRGGSSTVTNDPLLEKVDQLIRDGRYRVAENVARTALGAEDAARRNDSVAAALYADRLVEAMLLGRLAIRPEAIGVARRAVALKERWFGPDEPETARSLERLGRVLTTNEEYAEARLLLQRAQRLLEDELGPEHAEVASAKFATGSLLLTQGRPGEAKPWFEQALSMREKALGPHDPAIANTHQMIGTCLYLEGDFETAKSHLRRALEIYEQTLGSYHPSVADSLVSLAEAQNFNDELADAKLSYERALVILEGVYGPESIMAATALSGLGYAHLAAADWTAATGYFERSLAIYVRELGEDNRLAVGEILALGIVRNDMGDFAGAAELERRAAEILEKIYGPWHPELGRALRHLGVSLTNLGRYPEAEPVMLRALAIAERNFGQDSPAVGNALRSIGGSLYLDAGEYGKAQAYSLRALEVFEKSEPADRPSTVTAAILGDLARSSRGLGDLPKALEYAQRGLQIHANTMGASHPDNADYLADIARMQFETGQPDAGLASALRAEVVVREHLILTAQVSSEHQALAFASARPPAIDLLVTAATEHPEHAHAAIDAAWDSEIRSRALVLDEMGARRRILNESQDPALKTLVGDLQNSTEQLANLVIRGPGARSAQSYGEMLEAARKDRERAELVLAARSEEYRDRLEWSHAGLGDVAAALPVDSALVSFVRYGRFDFTTEVGDKPPAMKTPTPSYAAFVLSSARAAPELVPLGSAAAIDALVVRWRETTAREALAAGRASKAGEASYRKVAEELRRAVWDPVARHLGAAQHVFIVPDGALNLVTFAALPVGGTGYLVEGGPTLHYLPAERDLLGPDKVNSRGGLLALSNPDFDDRQLFAALGSPRSGATTAAAFRGSRSACGSFQSMHFERLPASAQETGQIVRLWEDPTQDTSSLHEASDSAITVQSFTGPAANETMFKRTASGHRVLHLATHGFFLGGDCQSALEAPAAERISSASSAVTRENPLLLSGLVLAGANHREAAGADEDDGILTAQEIATLDLNGTEWAVLSACDTGTGEIRAGEGVFGLRRAFQLAGARTVIMSLWPVEDEVTRQWMAALYRHRFVEGKSTAGSVNGASLELLRQRRARGESTHPFYWAGFIAAGDWR